MKPSDDDLSGLMDGDPRIVMLMVVGGVMFFAPTLLSNLPVRAGALLIKWHILAPAASSAVVLPGTGTGLDVSRLWVLGLAAFATLALRRSRSLRAKRSPAGTQP